MEKIIMKNITYIMRDAYNHDMQLVERGNTNPSFNRHEFEIVNDYNGKNIISPITGSVAICDDNFHGYNFLIESDEDTLDNQLITSLKLFKEKKVARIVYSGGKSFHCIIHCSESIEDVNERKFIFDKIRNTLFNGCKCDIQNKNKARKTRRPNAWRWLKSEEDAEKFINRIDENPLFAKLVEKGIIQAVQDSTGNYFVSQALIKEDWSNVLDVSEWRKEWKMNEEQRIRAEILRKSHNFEMMKRRNKSDWHNLPAVKIVLHTGKGSRDADLNRACYSMKNNGYESEISMLIDEVECLVGSEIANKFRRQYC